VRQKPRLRSKLSTWQRHHICGSDGAAVHTARAPPSSFAAPACRDRFQIQQLQPRAQRTAASNSRLPQKPRLRLFSIGIAVTLRIRRHLCTAHAPRRAAMLHPRTTIAQTHRRVTRKRAAADRTAHACGKSLDCAYPAIGIAVTCANPVAAVHTARALTSSDVAPTHRFRVHTLHGHAKTRRGRPGSSCARQKLRSCSTHHLEAPSAQACTEQPHRAPPRCPRPRAHPRTQSAPRPAARAAAATCPTHAAQAACERTRSHGRRPRRAPAPLASESSCEQAPLRSSVRTHAVNPAPPIYTTPCDSNFGSSTRNLVQGTRAARPRSAASALPARGLPPLRCLKPETRQRRHARACSSRHHQSCAPGLRFPADSFMLVLGAA
jgi:hypothetical protein